MKRLLALGLFSLFVACTITEPSSGDDDDDGGSSSGDAPACAFEGVMPGITCGDNAGMVCPANVYCDACATDIVVDCTCTDGGTSLGNQFICDDCATFCSSGQGGDGSGGSGGGPVLTADQQLCADWCAATASAPPCPAIADCEAGCAQELQSASCGTLARTYFTCSAATTWTCSGGDIAIPDGCSDELNAYYNCLMQ